MDSKKKNVYFFFFNLPFIFCLDNCNPIRSSSPSAGGAGEALDSIAEASKAVAESTFSSERMVTRSQQWAANNKAKKYSLRQSRSSGSDTEANGEVRRASCPSKSEQVSWRRISTFLLDLKRLLWKRRAGKIICRMYVLHSCIEALCH